MSGRALAISMVAVLCAVISLWHVERSTSVVRRASAFYVWQYEWSEEVANAVRAADALHPDAYYVMAGEIGGPGVPSPNWNALAALHTPVVPVLRVFARKSAELETAPTNLARHIIGRIHAVQDRAARAGLHMSAIQLDLDCPERLLPFYARFLRELRPALPGLRLEITALPCHLPHGSFRRVAAAVDSYTLQVHGLTYPTHRDEPAAIMEPRIAAQAIRTADRIGRPYRLALPTYATELVFARADGRFRGLLHPYSPRPDPARHEVRLLEPDLALTQHLLARANASSVCQGVLWFRLPVPGEAPGWDIATIAALNARCGVPPTTETSWQVREGGEAVLVLVNHRDFTHARVAIELTWANTQGSHGLIAPDTDDSTGSPGGLPARLLLRMPPAGRPIPVAWFRVDQPPASISVCTP